MSTTLYRKYRPARWEEIAGQQHVKVTLSFEVATGKIAHAYLFAGPRGIGKTTIARIFAKAINCTADERKRGKGGEPCGECENCATIAEGRAMDIIEIDAASHRGIDNVRENVIENARFAPSRLAYKVFIIDEVHMLTTEAFNALLKTLEEPPAHAVFILATTELHKVPQTIISRCQRFDFRKIPFNDLVDRLHSVADREGCKVDQKVLEEIARHADGCLRDAEGLLGKVLTVGDGKRVTYDDAVVVLSRSDFESVASFVDALIKRDTRSAVMAIGDVLEGGADIDQFAGDVIELMRKVLLVKMSGNPDVFTFDLDEGKKKRLGEWAELVEIPALVKATELLLEKRKDLKTSHPVQLPLELAAVRICERVPEASARPPSRPPQGGAKESMPVHAVSAKATEEEEVRAEKSPKPEKAGKAIPSPAPEALSTDGAPAMALEELHKRWMDFIKCAGEASHSFNYLLVDSEPLEITGHLVKVGFAHGFHVNKLKDEKNRRKMEAALTEAMGVELYLEGVVLEKKKELVHTDAAPDESAQEGASAAHELASAFGGTVE